MERRSVKFLIAPMGLLVASVFTDEAITARGGGPMDPLDIMTRQGPVVAVVCAFLWYLVRRDRQGSEDSKRNAKQMADALKLINETARDSNLVIRENSKLLGKVIQKIEES